MKNICFVTDPLVTTIGAVRPALLLSREFQKRGYNVTLLSPYVSGEVKHMIEKEGIEVKSLDRRARIIKWLPTLEAWAYSLFKRESFILHEDSVIINTSSCLKIYSHIYYAQGPMTEALDDMVSEMPMHYKYVYVLSSPVLKYMERRLIKEFRQLSNLFIANSKFCASLYEDMNIKTNGVIYPPLNCNLFKPATSKPSEDYLLTYFGVYSKETKFLVIKKIADNGVKIKAFGSKVPYVPKYILKHPNILFLGKVSDEDLVNLYSNALCTLFVFNHEPFGYIPVESMACGTPVLTYNRQGPSESVIDGVTGWLANNDEELIRLAVKIWRDGYPQWMRNRCRERALEFDVKAIAEKWHRLIKRIL
ncbi:MAG: glycosyltransferase family 4 protein [Candidatus Korarchaeota archaeon]|nr:glycosyltransferase family 4 protein [Thermoproteota archaeon]